MPTKYAGGSLGHWPASGFNWSGVGHRVLVFYCRTLIRELDLQTRSSILVQRWHPQAEADDGPENASS